MSVERIIGIDFGTSTSVIRVKRYNNGQPVEDRLSKQDVIFDGSRPTVPTLIQRTDKGTYYGYDAQVSRKGETLYQNFKMNLESSDSAQKQEARELTEEFFAYLAKTYKSQSEGGHFGDSGDTQRTIVSYPVKWSDETKEFMIQTAEKAGFKNVEGMDEAQAAIHAVTVQSEDFLTKHGLFTAGVPCNILLVDMGAGTTDLVLCRHTPGERPKNEILCTWPKEGDALFGGREVDELLREYVRSLLPEDMAPMVLKKNGAKEFKVWKESVVSPALERSETVEEFSSIDNVVELLEVEMEPYELDRARFEELAEEYLGEFPKLIADCIEHSDIQKEGVDLVILTGGHSQWYFVKEMLDGRGNVDLPKIKINPERIIPITRPQETVALGMIYKPLSAEFEKTSNDIVEYYRKKVDSLFAAAQLNKVIAVKSDGTVAYNDSLTEFSEIAGWNDIVSISNNMILKSPHGAMIAGLKKDGTVIAAGLNDDGQCNVQGWRDIAAISCGSNHTVGLKKDGTVLATGNNECGQCNVQDWRDITSISCGRYHTVGLKKDGTVVAVGSNDYVECNVRDWRDIVFIMCGLRYTVGLKRDGTVVATGNNDYGQCNVQDWRDIVAISCSHRGACIVGLKKDGTVVATGDNDYGQCDVQEWRDIAAISCSPWHTVGLKKDGTVVAAGLDRLGQCNVQTWQNIVAVYANYQNTCGVREDGEVIYTDYEAEKDSSSGILIITQFLRKLPYNLFHETPEPIKEKTVVSVVKNILDTAPAQGTDGNTVADPAMVSYYQKNVNSLFASAVRVDVVAVKSDGTVVCDGSVRSDIKSVIASWNDIISITNGIPENFISDLHSFMVGLKKDGTVVAVGNNECGQCNVKRWGDIAAISCGHVHTVGLKRDGTVVATGYNRYGQCRVKSWRDVAAITCGFHYTVGLKRDGTVVATGWNKHGQRNVQGWGGIAAISCGDSHTVGLKRDGTVVAVGNNGDGQCNVQGWRDVVAISCAGWHTVGLKRDGTVVAAGYNEDGRCNVQGWRNIIAVYTSRARTYGVTGDGRVIYTDHGDKLLPGKLF